LAHISDYLAQIPASTKAQSPLEKDDHPELNNLGFLDEEKTQQYQSLVSTM